jgi:hypothetical protein
MFAEIQPMFGPIRTLFGTVVTSSWRGDKCYGPAVGSRGSTPRSAERQRGQR